MVATSSTPLVSPDTFFINGCSADARDFHVEELADQIANQVALIEAVKENGLPVEEHEEFLVQLKEERELWSKKVST